MRVRRTKKLIIMDNDEECMEQFSNKLKELRDKENPSKHPSGLGL